MSIFIKLESNDNINKYIKLLQITGALSSLFSNSETPYLYYRAMENIFCQAFKATDLSRGDTSVDASKCNVGIGLKTFLHNNGKTYQKIAEFNKDSDVVRTINLRNNSYKDKDRDIIRFIAELRNNRLGATQRIHDLEMMIYHNITRRKNEMFVFEETMDYIDIENISNIEKTGNTIAFDDAINQYNFSLSKNTLFKRFITNDNNFIVRIPIKILPDPFSFLLEQSENLYQEQLEPILIKKETDEDFIILPLYSELYGRVMEKSGLNMWNAEGRLRHPDEVYIPIPAWIHKINKDFFIYKNFGTLTTDAFNVELPNGKILSMKVVQQGGKGLSSDPNSALGKWILRDVLQLPTHVIVTMDMLKTIGIDSVKLTKQKNNKYRLDFLKLGSFEEYKDEMCIENI